MKRTVILTLLILIVFQFVKAENFRPDSTIVFAYTSTYSSIYDSISNNCIEHYSSTNIPKGEVVVLTGYKQCVKKGFSGRANYYEIYFRGDTYYLNEKDLKFTEDVNYIDLLSSLSDEDYNKFRVHSLRSGLVLWRDELEKLITFFNTTKNKGLAIIRWNIFDVSEYTEGTGIRFRITNPTKKTIKYISFTVRGYNPVNDPVRAKDGNYSYTLRGVGPMAPEESATYEWDYIWFTDIVKSAKITSIKIQYMDGTIKLIENVNSITMSDSLRDIYDSI